MKRILYAIVFLAACAVRIQAAGESPSSPLRLGQGQFRIHKSKITLSGFSSGGTFAQMLQFSYSSLFQGVAVFSHNFYRCGPPTGVVDDYDRVCTKLFNLTVDQYYKPELVHEDIRQYQRNRQIEDVSNLRNRRLYVYAGLSSFLFAIEQSLGILKVYEPYIQNPKAIRTRVQNANLVLPTNNPLGVPCTAQADKNAFIGNCGFSGAYEALSFLLDDDVSKRHNHQGESTIELIEPRPGQKIRLAPLRYFDQSEFSRGVPNPYMDSVGLLYIPSSGCKASKCLLHFYFHGCSVGRELNGTTHIVNSGYLELAELNQIIMVFPQALTSRPNNVIGCWDTFGIGGPLYATQEGPQIQVVKRILDTFVGGGNLGASQVLVPPAPNLGPGSGGFSGKGTAGNGFGPARGSGFGQFGGSGWSNSGSGVSGTKSPSSLFSSPSASGSSTFTGSSNHRGWGSSSPGSRGISLVRFP